MLQIPGQQVPVPQDGRRGGRWSEMHREAEGSDAVTVTEKVPVTEKEVIDA
jgi:hypothetical protein